MIDLPTTLGQRIRSTRKNRGLTQEGLAELCSLTRITIARYENDTMIPSADAVLELANALNVSSDYLLGKSEPKDNGTDIKFAVFGDPNVTDAQFEEVKQFARFIRETG